MSTPLIEPDWTLSFEDHFEGPVGSPPCPKHWKRDVGGNGWGNNELQSYTDGNANAYLDGMGNLVIEARSEKTIGPDGIQREYSSAKLLTQGIFSQQYGRVEARIKIPRGQGIWPAFWMLGDNYGPIQWPECGEIDILESIGPVATTLYATIHGPGYSGGDGLQNRYESDQSLSEDFHVYGLEWDASEIRWYLDHDWYATIKRSQVGDHPWPFDQPYYLILNLAVGGDWPGAPDESTAFPQFMTVDYVRVYQSAANAFAK